MRRLYMMATRPLSLFDTTKLAKEVVFEEGCSICGVYLVFAFEYGPRQIVVFSLQEVIKKNSFLRHILRHSLHLSCISSLTG